MRPGEWRPIETLARGPQLTERGPPDGDPRSNALAGGGIGLPRPFLQGLPAPSSGSPCLPAAARLSWASPLLCVRLATLRNWRGAPHNADARDGLLPGVRGLVLLGQVLGARHGRGDAFPFATLALHNPRHRPSRLAS